MATREAIDLAALGGDDWGDLAEEPPVLYDDALLAADMEAESQPLDTREPDANASAEFKKFAPAYGKTWTYGTGENSRTILQLMTWRKGSLDAFERSGTYDHAHEHDMKLRDPSYNGSRKHPFCKGQRWWLKHDGIGWRTTYPDDADPWLDETIGDNCSKLDFTIGIKYPLELEEGKKYETVLSAEKGGRNSSPYSLAGQKLTRYCGGEPRTCAARGAGSEEQLLVGPSKGSAPECRRWRNGRRSRPC